MFEANYSIQGQTGKIGVIQVVAAPNFSQIFSGSPQYYPGSSIEVQEVMRIVTNVADPSKVDSDTQWFDNKLYLGSYQIISNSGLTLHREGDDGFLVSQVQEVVRYSHYTITANPNTLVAQHEQLAIDNCNYYIQPDVYLFPDEINPVPGFRTHEINPLFLGSTTLSKAPLADTPFNQKIFGVGLFLKPGVEGVRVEYKLAVINDIYTDYPSAEAPKCVFGTPSCPVQFAAFLVTANAFETKANCENLVGVGNCTPLIWTCPTDPDISFTYWTTNLTGG
jgi:hypothetical protein